MNKTWLAFALVMVAGLALYAGRGLLPERRSPGDLQAEEDLRQRCHRAQVLTDQALIRYRAGTPGGLIEAAGSVKALGADEGRCSVAARQVFDSARNEIKRMTGDAEWLVLGSEVELETVTALASAWGTPEVRAAWQRERDALAAAVAAGQPATLNIVATEDGKPACLEDTLRLSETRRTRFRRAVLARLSALHPERPIVMGRLADERIVAGIAPLFIDADFQFEVFADARPGTGMRIWIPGRLVMSFADGDEPPLSFSVEREVPENISARIWSCDWVQAEELLEDLLAKLPAGLLPQRIK